MAEDLGKTPMSPGLQATLMRAREYASSQSHLQVTVEHLLLALSEDEDAGLVLQSSQVDLNRLRNDVAGFLGNLSERSSGGPTNPTVSPGLAEILKYATLAAKQGRRNRIDGAIVLAALVGDGRSMAASFLKAQGLTFEEAIRVLQRAAQAAPQRAPQAGAGTSTPAPAAATPRSESNTENILAAARERVEQRTLPPRADPSSLAASRTPLAASARKGLDTPAPPTYAAPPETPMDAPTAVPANSTAGRTTEAPRADITEAAPPARDMAPATLPPKLPEPAATRTPPELAELAELATAPERAPQTSPPALDVPLPGMPDASSQRPSPAARQPSSNWAPPPLPTPPAPQPAAHPRAPSSPPPPVRRPIPMSGPSLTERLADRPPERPPPRPEPTAGAPWPDPTPRPVSPQAHPQVPQNARPPQPSQPTPSQPGPGGAWMAGPPPSAPLTGDITRAPAIEPGQVSYALPKRMQQGKPAAVEVRIARAPLAGSGSGPMPTSLRPEFVAVRAITARLRGAKGAFAIEPGSPETQWDQAVGAAARAAGDVAVWRFTVTPLSGEGRVLQLMVAARTVGVDGMIADTVLPDQVLPVKIARNLKRPLRRLLGIIAIALTSIVLWTVIERVFAPDVWRLVQRLAGF